MEIKEKGGVETFGKQLAALRIASGLPQSRVAAAAGISAGYYAGIECGAQVPPPGATLSRILAALQCDGVEARVLQEAAATERGFAPQDAGLPDEVQRLIADLRVHGPTLPARFVQALRTSVREAAD